MVFPQRAQLRDAGFVKRRQDFRDSVVAAGNPFRRMPAAFEYRSARLTGPTCNLNDQQNPNIVVSQRNGYEQKRRTHVRRFPESSRNNQFFSNAVNTSFHNNNAPRTFFLFNY